MACTFLAAKIEENCRRIRDVANVFHHIKQKRMGRYVEYFIIIIIMVDSHLASIGLDGTVCPHEHTSSEYIM